MRSVMIGVAGALFACNPAAAQTAAKLTPSEIDGGFFKGQPFIASTPSNIRFKMVFTDDGKVTREPLGKSGIKGEGKWKLSKDGFCTEWKGSKPTCFVLVSTGDNKWSVVRGAATVAIWSK